MKAVVLLSGGLDSSTVLYQAKAEGMQCYALSFDYHQRHRQELEAARAIADSAGVVEHQCVHFDLRQWGGSALTDDRLTLPRDRDPEAMAQEIPITYVPARNTIFLSFGLAYAEAIAAPRVYIGVNALDYSGYPDCRPDYIAAMGKVFALGTKQGREGHPIEIHTPLIHRSKVEIIQLGNQLGVPWAKTWSCYSEGGGQTPPIACGHCDSCRLRLAAFQQLNLRDPLPYGAAARPGAS
ncbi:7-cyano-7-deazaguanine synthase QueC [Lyngbya confervoides]|uniref:7-cyano-7-deazaguanine synthase n=1 Tax=Lyngbya confervoides BDU141951 TaxID=1574623 RepID=A0ABD4T742_9CYAN|nr:7-cyano-7-deazaguanine synthase QueC [Lyngbya confervoides]MCM1984087.1 7-cyano-7-deazaguanine synthase QueC [Lyngbya confervoides BDU141951]